MNQFIMLLVSFVFLLTSICYVIYYIFTYRNCNRIINNLYGKYEEYYREVYGNVMHRIGALSNTSPYRDCFESNRKYLVDASPRRLNNYQILKNRIEEYTTMNISDLQINSIWNQVNTIKRPVCGTFVLCCNHISKNNNRPIFIFSDPYNSITTSPTNLSYKKSKKYFGRILIVDLIFDTNHNINLTDIKETIYTYHNILTVPELKSMTIRE